MSGLLLATALAFGAGGAPEVTPARDEAALYAVTHGLVVRSIVSNCARFRERLKQDPDAALAAWRERNAERAAAAEAYFVFAHAAIERQKGSAAAEAYTRGTRAISRRKANDALNDIFERAAPQVWTCERWVAAIAEGQTDLNWESKYLPALDDLVEFERKLRGTR